MLQVNQLSFSYPNEVQDVLKNIDFSLESGKILAIVGPSGCGKTTLLKLIYGLLAPSKGDIKWNSEAIPNPKDVLVPGFSKMKFVEQDFNLMPYIKVYENMQQHILHLTEEEREPILKYWLDFLNIQHIETKKAKDLSGGQMQRVAIAKAFIANAELLLLDEPFSNLDTVTKSYLISDLKRIIKEKNTSAIVVVHHPEDALEIADEVLVLDKGQIAQQDTPQNVYIAPKSKTVASLFGLANFFTLSEAKNILSLDLEHFSQVEKEILIRPNQLTADNLKTKFEVLSELFLGYSTIQKVEASGKHIWITKS
jgi:ABC-type sugar transport system ATPase subunit